MTIFLTTLFLLVSFFLFLRRVYFVRVAWTKSTALLFSQVCLLFLFGKVTDSFWHYKSFFGECFLEATFEECCLEAEFIALKVSCADVILLPDYHPQTHHRLQLKKICFASKVTARSSQLSFLFSWQISLSSSYDDNPLD
jgi:hypothetical protein